MKIRTITLGISDLPTPTLIRWASQQLARAQAHFSSEGYTVQTRRLALNHWDAGLGLMSTSERESLLRMVDSLCAEGEITFCGIGITPDPELIEHASHLIAELPRLSGCADVGSVERGLNRGGMRAAAKGVRYLASHTEQGFGNFRFGAGFCFAAGNPFFPGAFHRDERPSFAIGLENSDLLVAAFDGSGELETARERLFDLLSTEFRRVEELALSLAASLGLGYGGIDTSIAPSVHPDESVVRAFRSANVEFGGRCTLAACGMITDVLKSLPVKRIGYCGIMLPVLEDAGLAEAAGEGRYGITELLAYSSVCGVGLDMVPIPGDVSQEQLEALLLDVGVMAVKLKKPLSVRVLPVPGKRAGELTQFQSPYVCNSRVLSV